MQCLQYTQTCAAPTLCFHGYWVMVTTWRRDCRFTVLAARGTEKKISALTIPSLLFNVIVEPPSENIKFLGGGVYTLSLYKMAVQPMTEQETGYSLILVAREVK